MFYQKQIVLEKAGWELGGIIYYPALFLLNFAITLGRIVFNKIIFPLIEKWSRRDEKFVLK